MSKKPPESSTNAGQRGPFEPDDQEIGSHTQLLAILERISDGFVALDREWRYTYVNTAAAKMLQRDTPLDLIGKHIWTEYPDGLGKSFHQAYEKSLQTQEPVVFEHYYQPWDLWFENRVYPSADGLTIYFSDITARKKAEVALQQSAAVFAHTRDGIALTDEKSNIVNVNPAFEKITGYTFDQVKAESIRLLGDIPVDESTWSRVLETSEWSGEIVGKRKDGSTYEQLLKMNVFADDESAASEALWVFSDISQERLSQRIEKQLVESQNLEVIGRLTGGVAHDFNNLLAAILGNLEVLKLRIDNDQHGKFIDAGIAATIRGADLTRNMLSFARRARLSPAVLDLNESVVQTSEWIERTLPATIAVNTSIPKQLSRINADPASTESALLNLIMNARDAMPNGGLLTIECSNVEIGPGSARNASHEVAPGRYVVLAVSDTGSGIEQDIIKRIFDPFFTTKPTGFGTGLGLSMVQGFMKQSNGAVSVYSEIGVGTTFKLYWPVHEDATLEGSSDGVPIGRLVTTGRRVLVAEDSSEVLKVIVHALREAGYAVHSARSGDQAKELVDNGLRIDLLLTDIVMPGDLQGPALARALRTIQPDLPVVFMTGYANEAAIHGNGLRPADICVNKPVRFAELIDAIESNLDESQRSL